MKQDTIESVSTMKHVFTQPFIGYSYFTSTPRVLVLGHNHYCEKNEDFTASITINTVSSYLKERARGSIVSGEYNSFLYFEKSVIGENATPEEAIAFWNSKCFYNYVQSNNTSDDKIKAMSKKQYTASYEAFFEILRFLKPKYVIAWGKTNYSNLPPVDFVDIDPDGQRICEYTVDGCFKTRVLCIQHPSMGYNREIWRPIIESFLSGKWDESAPKQDNT